MTNQETFDTVCKGIIAQGRQAVGEDNACRYRAGELKCAAGMLIPDDRYDPRMELGGALYTTGLVYNLVCVELGHDFALVKRLQECHDGVTGNENFVETFKVRARHVAKVFGLSDAVLD